MNFVSWSIDLILHFNHHLAMLVHTHGMVVYGVIALIIFCEVGLVITPFLPGDSMLFAIGTLCATDAMELSIVLTLFPMAAILGDNFNRLIGVWFGHKMFSEGDGRIFSKKNLAKAQFFYAQHGAKAVTLCRFVPFLRTYIPFVAGMAEMRWRVFLPFSILGGVGWVFVCIFSGYYFGNTTLTKNHFELVIVAVAISSSIPVGVEFLKRRTYKYCRK